MILEQHIPDPSDDLTRGEPTGNEGKLRALLEGDKSDADDVSRQVDARHSSSTLNVVKQKLKKHLSRDSALSKRHSRSSVGTSEEEIERRAELRRIRERRIREELSNEGLYDDDAKSISSVPETTMPSGKLNLALWVPGDTIPFQALATPMLDYPTYAFPELAPLTK